MKRGLRIRRTGNGQRVKTLSVVDDCSKAAVLIAVDTSISELCFTRVLDQVKLELAFPW